MKTLRDYQQNAVDAVFSYLENREGDAPLIVAPVGAGKTLIIADIIRRIYEQSPRARVIVMTNTRELLKQNMDELREYVPGVDAGFYCDGLGEKKLSNDITLASIQSIIGKASLMNRPADVVIVDEAHTIPHNESTQYRRFLDKCRSLNENVVIIGLTGSPFRADTGRLDEGEGKLFDGIAYEIDIRYLMDAGFLVRPVTPQLDTHLNTEGVQIRNGDFVAGQLEAAVDNEQDTQACVLETIRLGRDRKKWLVFAAGVKHAGHIAEQFEYAGIPCGLVLGTTPKAEREYTIQAFRQGHLRCLINVATLTTGFNVPDIDLVSFMRPTRSPVLYIQMAGRGLRIAGDKDDCLFLDFGRVIETLGPIDKQDIRKKPGSGKKGEANPTKTCPNCAAICNNAQRFCFECSYQFTNGQPKLEDRASEQSMISGPEPVLEYEVFTMICGRYKSKSKPGSPEMMRVEYGTEGGLFSEYICFNHTGRARDMAVRWHNDRYPGDLTPDLNGALQIAYSKPAKLKVQKEGKYWRVVGSVFGAPPATPDYDADTIPF